MASGPSYVVGIDFGTTFSGVAWALEGSKGSDEDIKVASAWDKSNRTYAKVPSVIAYHGSSGCIRWGYQVDPWIKAFRGIKLLLDEDQNLDYAPSLASKNLLRDKDAVQVTADYLEQLFKHAKQIMIKDRLMPDDTDMTLRFVLTVPAVWSHKAKEATKTAATKAGIPETDLSLISEPEAAALHALRKVPPGSFSENDVFIVCDAGGGTVDLISYRIKALEPLELVEVVPGQGGTCGSMFLDERFENLLREKMGDKWDALPPQNKQEVLRQWQDRVKPLFSGRYEEKEVSTASSVSCSDTEEYDTITEDGFETIDDFDKVDDSVAIAGVNDDSTIPIKDGQFPLKAHDLEEIFEPIVRHIEELVAGQVTAIAQLGRATKAIILVGGFGSSHYLFRRLQEGNPTVKILQPEDAWSAVVRGAVHRGLQGNQVKSRVARQHYGVPCQGRWHLDIHGANNKMWSELEEEYKGGEMAWFIKESSPMYEDRPVMLDFYFTIRVEEAKDKLPHEVTLYRCNEKEAPKAEDTNVKTLCTLEADLHKIPKGLFQKRCNSKGVEYYRIPYTLVMTPASASLIFELQFEGVSYGSVRSKYS